MNSAFRASIYRQILHIWLSLYCATLCSIKFEEGLMHKDTRNQITECLALTLRMATKSVRQEYHNSTIGRCSSKEENTPARLSLRYVQVSRRASLFLATKGEFTVLWVFYLYNMNFDVSSVLRDLLCILKKTLVFFFHLLFNQLQNFYIYAQCETLGEGHPMHNVCKSSSISPPANMQEE